MLRQTLESASCSMGGVGPSRPGRDSAIVGSMSFCAAGSRPGLPDSIHENGGRHGQFDPLPRLWSAVSARREPLRQGSPLQEMRAGVPRAARVGRRGTAGVGRRGPVRQRLRRRRPHGGKSPRRPPAGATTAGRNPVYRKPVRRSHIWRRVEHRRPARSPCSGGSPITSWRPLSPSWRSWT